MHQHLIVSNGREIAGYNEWSREYRDDSRFILISQLDRPIHRRTSFMQFLMIFSLFSILSCVWYSVGYYYHLKKIFINGINPWEALPYISDCGAESSASFFVGLSVAAVTITLASVTLYNGVEYKLSDYSDLKEFDQIMKINNRSRTSGFCTGVGLICVGILDIKHYFYPHQIVASFAFGSVLVFGWTTHRMFSLILNLKHKSEDRNDSEEPLVDRPRTWTFYETKTTVRIRGTLAALNILAAFTYLICLPEPWYFIFRSRLPDFWQGVGAVSEFMILHITVLHFLTLLPYLRSFDFENQRQRQIIIY